MFQVKDEPVETIHVYVVREGQQRPSLIPVIISLLALSVLIAFCALAPYQQPEMRKTLRIPAVLLPLKTFSVSDQIIPTGIKTYPATIAHGNLTITNGSVIAQELPKGLLFTGNDGAEVITEASVFVPAGSAAGYGFAWVAAHAVTSGRAGDITTLDIDSVEGSSLYIRNLRPFTGGQDSYSVRFITPQDRQTTLTAARAFLATLEARTRAILMQPCNETINGKKASISVLWACRFAAYPHLPGLHITSIRALGRELLVNVVYTLRPRPFTGK